MIEKFNKEVLVLGAAACLPANLSDDWLNWLTLELDFLRDEERVGPNTKPPSCALAAVIRILIYQNGGRSVKIHDKKLFERMGDYLVEIELEKLCRFSDIKCEAATLDTIFSNRKVRFWRS